VTSDVEQVRELVVAYAERLDVGDLDGVAALFAAGVVRTAQSGERVGRDAVRRMYDPVILYEGGTPRTKHVLGNVEVAVADDRRGATSRCTFTVWQATPGGPLRPVLAGRYHDEFERVDDRWRFSVREILSDLVGDLFDHMGRR
jgi:3-phenylpropionate/cinnamic acid dioxygenase small subunit